jgi:hypothetical protein
MEPLHTAVAFLFTNQRKIFFEAIVSQQGGAFVYLLQTFPLILNTSRIYYIRLNYHIFL